MKPTDIGAARTFRPLRIATSALALVFAAHVLPAASNAVEDEDAFYQLGIAVGRSLSEFRLSKEELAVVQRGLLASVNGDEVPDQTEAQMKRITEIRNSRVAQLTVDYLNKTKQEKGAQVQPSGLIYFEIEAGSGQSPVSTDEVKVHYHGTLSNGAVFDSSALTKPPWICGPQRGSPRRWARRRSPKSRRLASTDSVISTS